MFNTRLCVIVEQDAKLELLEQFESPIGNVNNKTTMSSGTADDVRREVLDCLRAGAPGGGYIISTDHSLHDGMPIENVLTYIDTARTHGTYPLAL